MIPYGHQSIDETDISAVVDAMRSGWLTQGVRVMQFEERLAAYCGARFAVVCANGTAALHAAFFAAGLGPGDEFITASMTFPATANAGLYVGAKPVFVDIDPKTGSLDPKKIEAAITENTKAIVPIDYMGRPAALDRIRDIAEEHGLVVIEDACQALGGEYKGKKIGSVSDLSVFSFHPVKSITTGEGGAILTDNEAYYQTMKQFITHGVTREPLRGVKQGDWYFEMQMLGYNYRLTDMQSALGMSQLHRLGSFVKKRRAIAEKYFDAFASLDALVLPPRDTEDIHSSWHLFVVRLRDNLVSHRADIFQALRDAGIGVQVHHIPVHRHPYYKKMGYTNKGLSETEKWYNSVISLPLYPDLTDVEQSSVIEKVTSIIVAHA